MTRTLSWDNISIQNTTSDGLNIPRFTDVGQNWVFDFAEKRYLRRTELLELMLEFNFQIKPDEIGAVSSALYDRYSLPRPATAVQVKYISGEMTEEYVLDVVVEGDVANSDGELIVYVETSGGFFVDRVPVSSGDDFPSTVSDAVAASITGMADDVSASNADGVITVNSVAREIAVVVLVFQEGPYADLPAPPPPEPVFVFRFLGQKEGTNEAAFDGYGGVLPYVFTPGNGSANVQVNNDQNNVLYDYGVNGGYVATLTDSSEPPQVKQVSVFLDWYPL